MDAWRTRPRTSPFSRVSNRSANGPVCTSARPVRRASTTSSTRSSTTRSTRRSRATRPASTSRCCADGGCRVDRQRPRHPGRSAPRVPRQVRGRDRAHDAPRGRQVRRRGLQDLRRPARRRRVGRERAVAPPRARDPSATAAATSRRSSTAASPSGRSSASATPTDTARRVTFWPDGTIMEELEFRAQTLLERLREMAFLNKGLEIVFRDERRRPADRADLQVRRRHRRLRRRTSTRRRSRCSQRVIVIERHLRRAARSRSRCSGTPASTRACTRSRTTSPPPRAGCTKRASRRPSPTS